MLQTGITRLDQAHKECQIDLRFRMKIPFDDLEFPPDFNGNYDINASFQGTLFTGIAFDEDDEYYAEHPYKDGNVNGRCFELNKTTNTLLFEEHYIDGKRHGEFKKWDKDGKLVQFCIYEKGALKFRKNWNSAGGLLKHFDPTQPIDEEYYDDGSLYKRVIQPEHSDQLVQYTYYLGDESRWLVKCPHPKDTYLWSSSEFNTPLLLENVEVLEPQLHSTIISQFCHFILKHDKEIALTFLARLSQHNTPYLRSTAAFHLGELGTEEAKNYLKEMLNDHGKSKLYMARFGDGGAFSNAHTVAENAERALKKFS